MTPTDVKRLTDEGHDHYLRIFQARDGDVWVEVYSGDCIATGRIRNPWNGGGYSNHTHAALLRVIEAIKLDNAEMPQNRGMDTNRQAPSIPPDPPKED